MRATVTDSVLYLRAHSASRIATAVCQFILLSAGLLDYRQGFIPLPVGYRMNSTTAPTSRAPIAILNTRAARSLYK